jgi:hypothetical protein
MYVSINSKASDGFSNGKTTDARLHAYKAEFVHDKQGKVASLALTGTVENTHGTGSRGGDMKEYTKTVRVAFTPKELLSLLEASLANDAVDLAVAAKIVQATEVLQDLVTSLMTVKTSKTPLDIRE